MEQFTSSNTGSTAGSTPPKQKAGEEYAVLFINGLPIVFDKVNIVSEKYVATNTTEQPSLAGLLPVVMPKDRTLTLSMKIPTDKVGRAYFRGVKEILRLIQFLLAQYEARSKVPHTMPNSSTMMAIYKESLRERSEAVNLMTGHPAYPQAIQELQQLRAGGDGGGATPPPTTEKKAEGIQRPPQYALCTYHGIFTNLTFCMIKDFKCGGSPAASNEETWEIVLEEFNMGQYMKDQLDPIWEKLIVSKEPSIEG